MTVTGVLLLAGFAFLSALMVLRILPTLLTLPIMAAWIAFITGVPFTSWLNGVLLGGSLRLASPIALVVFGAMFARVIRKTGISDTIVKKAAELSGDRPVAVALVLTAATAFVFMGMSGLGSVIMVGSITIPIMTSAGISPLDASVLMLLGINMGLLANIAGYGAYIGIFGSDAALSYYLPAIVIPVLVTVIYILRNIPRGSGGENSLWDIAKEFVSGIFSLPVSLLHTLAGMYSRKSSGLLRRKQDLPAAALVTPILPLAVIYGIRLYKGFGPTDKGFADPVAAALLGFIVAALYAALLVCPGKTVNLLAGAFVEGIQDIAGVLVLFMGIGMLVSAAAFPQASAVIHPLLASVLPTSLFGMLCFFAAFAPAALYRGPLNMFGMGAGIAAMLAGLHLVPPAALCGMFIAVGYLQALADPTNSHNTWIGAFAGVDTAVILKRILPYSWAMCVLLLLYVAFTQGGPS